MKFCTRNIIKTLRDIQKKTIANYKNMQLNLIISKKDINNNYNNHNNNNINNKGGEEDEANLEINLIIS
jgi:hypothetical protein